MSVIAADLTHESTARLSATGLELKFTPTNVQDPGIRQE